MENEGIVRQFDEIEQKVGRLIEADWVAVLRGDEVLGTLGSSPDAEWLQAFFAGSGHLDELADALPSDLVWGRLERGAMTVVAGRAGRPIHERERVRISLLARLADALLD